jgi:hypothetical protein
MINNEVKQRVRNILETNKDARDCDRLLIAEIWKNDIHIGMLYNSDDMLEYLKDGTLTSPETIRRCRQHLQQNEESLRGLKYKVRQKLGEEVRNTISK